MLLAWGIGLGLIDARPADAQFILVSQAADGTRGNGDSHSGVMSADRRVVAFVSNATNLVANDTNGRTDVFVKDLATGAVDRVSVATDASERADDSGVGGVDVSWNGQIVVFSSTAALVAGDTNRCATGPETSLPCPDIYVRDRTTGTTTRISVTSEGQQANQGSDHPRISDDGHYVAFSSLASNLVPDDTNGLSDVFVYDRSTHTIRRVSVGSTGVSGNAPSSAPEISADGSLIVFLSKATNLDDAPDALPCATGSGCARVFIHDVARGTTMRVPIEPMPIPGPATAPAVIGGATIDARGRLIAVQVHEADDQFYGRYRVWLYDRVLRRQTSVLGATHFSPHSGILSYRMAMSDDGRSLVQAVTRSFFLSGSSIAVFDRDTGTSQEVPTCSAQMSPPVLSRDGRSVIIATQCAFNYPGDLDPWFDVYVYTRYDADVDRMDDDWERVFQLNPADSADASLDRDGDGVTNLDEYRAGTHPGAAMTRYFAEGSANGFFATHLAVLNTSGEPGTLVIRLLGPNGFSTSRLTAIGAHGRITVDYGPYADAPASDFSIIVESDQPFVADRTMTWDATGFGAHAETAIAAPGVRWLLAEGATHGRFDTFYLLLNPNDGETYATVKYLRPAPAPPLVKSYWLAPNSRRTIWVDVEDPALAATDVAADITATRPIVVERAMYLDVADPPQPFGAGHAGAGVTAAPRWFLAEGATGSFFDLYYLIANPSLQDTRVRVTYLLPAGAPLVREYDIAGESRLTISVDTEEAQLVNTPVSAVIESLDGTGIAVERSMWWPGQGRWQEGHLAAGSATTGRRWALAEGEVSDSTDTYVLIANTSGQAGTATLTIVPDSSPPDVQTVVLPPNSRVTVPMRQYASTHDQRFGVLVESDGPEIVVERAVYSSANGILWAAGTAALATRLP